MSLRAHSLFLIVFAVTALGLTARAQTTGTTTGTTTATTTTTSQNGVLVYDLKFKHVAGFNVDFYEGGYIVVPATGGGTGSAIFTGMDNGRKLFWSFTSAVNFYPAKTKGDRYTVISLAGGTDAIASMLAYGKANHTVKIDNSLFSISLHAATKLRGMAQASRDESAVAKQPKNGTIGFVEFAEMKLDLNESETDKANKKSQDVSTTFTALQAIVTGKGYVDAAATSTTGTTTGTTTGSTTGTTTTNPLGTGPLN